MEFGKKEGNYTPAFSMCMLPADISEHVKIEVDIEIADNDVRSHRRCFYVKSDGINRAVRNGFEEVGNRAKWM